MPTHSHSSETMTAIKKDTFIRYSWVCVCFVLFLLCRTVEQFLQCFFFVLLVIHSHILRKVFVLISIFAKPQGEDHIWDRKCLVYLCNDRMQLIDLWIAWKCHENIQIELNVRCFFVFCSENNFADQHYRMNMKITLRTIEIL